MAIPTWPATIAPSRAEWRLKSNTGKAFSPFDGSVETQERPGARWIATLVYDKWRRQDLAEYEAFLVALRGAAGRFYLWNHAREDPQGTALGTPLVQVSPPPTTTSIDTYGWTVSQTGLLLPGDYFGVDGELKMVTTQVDSDATGYALVEFEPPIRGTPVVDTPILTTAPTATFMLVDDDQTAFDYQTLFGNFSIQVMEAF